MSDNNNDNEFEVEGIKNFKYENGKFHFLIKWKNINEISWEPEENCTGCQTKIDEFFQNNSKLKNRTVKYPRTVNDYKIDRIVKCGLSKITRNIRKEFNTDYMDLYERLGFQLKFSDGFKKRFKTGNIHLHKFVKKHPKDNFFGISNRPRKMKMQRYIKT